MICIKNLMENSS